MNNTLYIESEIIKEFPEFIDGFLKTAYWTTKEKDNADVVISSELFVINNYAIRVLPKSYGSIFLNNALFNNNIAVTLAGYDDNTTLMKCCNDQIESKTFKSFQEHIDKHDMSDYEFGQYISAIVSDALIEDKIRSGEV